MSTPEITTISPAAALTEFMQETQTRGIEYYERIMLFGKFKGSEWTAAQQEYLAKFAESNGKYVTDTANWMAQQNILPYILTGNTLSTIAGIGTDSINTYALRANIDGALYQFTLGAVALVDRTDITQVPMGLNPLGNRAPRPTMRLGSVLFPRQPLPYNSAI